MSIEAIEANTEAFVNARNALLAAASAYQEELETVRKIHRVRLKKHMDKVLAEQARLEASIEANKELFVKPRTKVINGIKVGYQKGKSTVTPLFKDDELGTKFASHIVRAKNMAGMYYSQDVAAMVSACIKTKHSPVLDAIKTLHKEHEDIARILEFNVATGEDCVMVKPAETDVSKELTALIHTTLAETTSE